MQSTDIKQDDHALTVHIPDTIYSEIQRIESLRAAGIETLINQGLASLVADAQDQEMVEAATLLGLDPEMVDVEYAFDSFAQVILAED